MIELDREMGEQPTIGVTENALFLLCVCVCAVCVHVCEW